MKDNEILIIKNSIKLFIKEKWKIPKLEQLIVWPTAFFFQMIKDTPELYQEYIKINDDAVIELFHDIKIAIKDFVKENGKLPKLDQLIKGDDAIFFQIIKDNKEYIKKYNEIYDLTVIEIINDVWNVKMKKLFQNAYNKNSELFLSFINLNYSNDWKTNKDFNEVGKKVQDIIIELWNQLSSNIEGWKSKYGVFSWSLNDKFIKYVKIFFPHYDNIGVVISFRKV